MPGNPFLYRPKPPAEHSGCRVVSFIGEKTPAPPPDLDIRDLVDALTGAPLDFASSLFQCRKCKVFYQAHTYEVLERENDRRCASCQHMEIVKVADAREKRGQNAITRTITLENYKNFVGCVITFQGMVHSIFTSRRGTDYAVMFEAKRWVEGFKAVIFEGDIDRIGGKQYLNTLIGHRVQIRGLLIEHKTFGYEIIISNRTMIRPI